MKLLSSDVVFSGYLDLCDGSSLSIWSKMVKEPTKEWLKLPRISTSNNLVALQEGPRRNFPMLNLTNSNIPATRRPLKGRKTTVSQSNQLNFPSKIKQTCINRKDNGDFKTKTIKAVLCLNGQDKELLLFNSICYNAPIVSVVVKYYDIFQEPNYRFRMSLNVYGRRHENACHHQTVVFQALNEEDLKKWLHLLTPCYKVGNSRYVFKRKIQSIPVFQRINEDEEFNTPTNKCNKSFLYHLMNDSCFECIY